MHATLVHDLYYFSGCGGISAHKAGINASNDIKYKKNMQVQFHSGLVMLQCYNLFLTASIIKFPLSILRDL